MRSPTILSGIPSFEFSTGMLNFNAEHGFAEALLRGFRSGFLNLEEYRKLGQCESLEDVRAVLEETEYGSFLQDETGNLLVPTIVRKCKEKLAQEFSFLGAQASGSLVVFLDFIRKEKMIENVIFIIGGILNNKAPKDLLGRTNPLGHFEELKLLFSIDLSNGLDEIYRVILVDTPIAPYFQEYLDSVVSAGGSSTTEGLIATVISEADLEILKNILHKAWLEDFYATFGVDEDILGVILKTEADFRLLSIVLNALNSPLGSSQQLADRNALFPAMGFLYPEGTDRLRKAYNEQTVRQALEPFGRYFAFYEAVRLYYEATAGGAAKSAAGVPATKSIEDIVYTETSALYELAFEDQFHLAPFYAYVKLKEQEIRNIEWIANMIQMNRKDQATKQLVPIFAPRV